MKFARRHLCGMPSCYAAGVTEMDGRRYVLLAPDAPGPCYSFDAVTFEHCTVWREPGGTMSLVPLPGANGDFLAVQRFNPGFQAQDAEIVAARFRDGAWTVTPLVKLPYVHRFDILSRGGVRYLFCATLCTEKSGEDDWISPGGLYVAELPDILAGRTGLTRIAGGMTRNHGYWRTGSGDNTFALTSCDQGVYRVEPPSGRGGEWEIRPIMDRPVSDIALCDIDGDGRDELAAIEPFHGAFFTVYRETPAGYEPLYRHPGNMAFCHVVWGGTLRGEPVFIGGCRGGSRELFVLRWRNGGIIAETVDTGRGPSNVCVLPGPEHDMIVAANREAGEAAVYEVTDN